MVMHAAEPLKVMPCLFQSGVIHDEEVRHVLALDATPLHDAEELLRHSEQQAAPVVGGVGEETVEAVLADAFTEQPIPFLPVEAEHAGLKDADEQKVKQQHRTRNALLLGDACHLHDRVKPELAPYGHYSLPQTLFFTQKFAQLADFV